MSVTKQDLETLVDDAVIDPATARRIEEWLERRTEPSRPRFDLAHAAYYLGALVIIFAMGWFAIESWQRYGGWTLAVVAVAYAALFATLGEGLWRRGWRTPSGLLFTAAVGMTPLFAFGVQAGLGVWPGPETSTSWEAMRGHRLTLQVATAFAALLAMRLRPFAFHAAVLGAALLAVATDIGLLILPGTAYYQRQMVTLVAGLLLIGAAFLVDHRTREDYAFWLYLAGLLAFFFSALDQLRETAAFGAISLLFMFVAVILDRRAFMVVGALGLFMYLVHLAASTFRDSLLFPIALSAIGLAFILGGVAYARRQERVVAWLMARLPAGLIASLPQNR